MFYRPDESMSTEDEVTAISQTYAWKNTILWYLFFYLGNQCVVLYFECILWGAYIFNFLNMKITTRMANEDRSNRSN